VGGAALGCGIITFSTVSHDKPSNATHFVLISSRENVVLGLFNNLPDSSPMLIAQLHGPNFTKWAGLQADIDLPISGGGPTPPTS
jgi:hypothetical protein